MHDVFLSYSHDDWEFAQNLAGSLWDAGIDVFFDAWETPPEQILGNNFISELLSALSRSKSVILCYGASTGSWVDVERRLARIKQREDRGFQVVELNIPTDYRVHRDNREIQKISESLLNRLSVTRELKRGKTKSVSRITKRPGDRSGMWGPRCDFYKVLNVPTGGLVILQRPGMSDPHFDHWEHLLGLIQWDSLKKEFTLKTIHHTAVRSTYDLSTGADTYDEETIEKVSVLDNVISFEVRRLRMSENVWTSDLDIQEDSIVSCFTYDISSGRIIEQ